MIVDIYQCKECGNDKGTQIPEHKSLAECTLCSHLCDIISPDEDYDDHLHAYVVSITLNTLNHLNNDI